MPAELTVAKLIQSMPHDADGLEAARGAVLGDPEAYRAFENAFYASVPAEPTAPEDRLKAGQGRYLLGQETRALEVLKGVDAPPAPYLRARLLTNLGRFEEARTELPAADRTDGDAVPVLLLHAECAGHLADLETVRRVLARLEQVDPDGPSVPYVRGLLLDGEGSYAEANQQYRQALAIDPQDARALFRLAYGESLRGEAETAIELYERLCNRRPPPVGALINLGLLFEDEEDYQLAAVCFQRVLDFDPLNPRARLYYHDAVTSTRMFYDEERERKDDKRAQVLRIPVTDFELSVRSRNCLANMNVRTLGDLIRLSEQELLSFKNFGETSLAEIKSILAQKGLRLGMLAPPEVQVPHIVADPTDTGAVLTRAVVDLDLSVRSRKALDTLGLRTVGDLVDTPESRLLACKNFGQTSLQEIKKKLADLGLALRSP